MTRAYAKSTMGMTYDVLEGEDQAVIVRMAGELDISNVEALGAAVAPALEQRPERLILEVGELRFADSSAIALWVKWANAVPDIELRDAQPFLRRVVESMGLSEMLTVTP